MPFAQAFGATLEWDANPETNVIGYRVSVGTQSRQYDTVIDVGLATQQSFGSLPPGQTHYFAVTAYDSDGLESDLSDEVTYTLNGLTATPLADLTVFAGGVASFATTAAGTGPFGFVWKKDGAVIDGATDAVFTIVQVSAINAGTYTVEVSNAYNTVTRAAVLTVQMNETNALPGPLSVTVSGAASPVAISFLTEAGRQYIVQASVDAQSWQTIHSVTSFTNGTNQWLDADAPYHPMRFYRVLGSQP